MLNAIAKRSIEKKDEIFIFSIIFIKENIFLSYFLNKKNDLKKISLTYYK